MNATNEDTQRVSLGQDVVASLHTTAPTSWASRAWTSFKLALLPLVPFSSRSIKGLDVPEKKRGSQVSKWLHSFKRRRFLVESVPADIWLEVFRYLSVSELLLVRQTCKRLADISTEPSIWFPRYRELCNNVFTPPGLGQPTTYPTMKDLEKATFNRIKAERNWRSPKTSLRRTRSIKVETFETFSVVAGRWLFVATRRGDVKLHDFEEPAAAPRIPFDISEDFGIRCLDYMHTDIDHTQSRLTFNLCMSFTIKDGTSVIIVYRITDRGHGQDSSDLVATKIQTNVMSVSGRHTFYKFTTEEFSGRFFTRYFLPNEPGEHKHLLASHRRLEIYDWTLSTAETHTMHIVPVITVHPRVTAYCHRLLPNDQLAVFWPNVIKLYDLSALRTIDCREFIPVDEALAPYWVSQNLPSLKFTRGFDLTVSHPEFHFASSTARIAYWDKAGIFGLTVPSVGHGKPKHHKLLDVVYLGTSVIGVDKYLYCDPETKKTQTGSFTWPDYEQGSEEKHRTYGASSMSHNGAYTGWLGLDSSGTIFVLSLSELKYRLLQFC